MTQRCFGYLGVPLAAMLFATLLLAGGCDRSPAPPRAVILLIGDGLGPAQIALAREATLPPGQRFGFEQLPVTALMSTYSASNPVTDSAAAATALAGGVKTDNQWVGLDPHQRVVRRFSEVARAHGWKIGYVTDTEITHATPAGFYACGPRYGQEQVFAEQLLEAAPDVALGGGRKYFLPRSAPGSSRYDDQDLVAQAQEAGYTVLGQGDSLDPEPVPAKVLGLFNGGHIPYELDNARLPEVLRYPHLADLTHLALKVLNDDRRPFFLMIEGGRIDQAAHDFDAAGVVAQVSAFERAVKVVRDFQADNPDVLVLITADHATGGLDLTDFVAWDKLKEQKASVEWMVKAVRDEREPEGADFLREMTGYDGFTPERVDRIRNFGDKYEAARTLGTYLSDYHNVTWLPRVDPLDPDTPGWSRDKSTNGHTGEDVPLFAGGPGAERFQGVLDNTEVPLRLVDLLGWELRQPDQGGAAASCKPRPTEP